MVGLFTFHGQETAEVYHDILQLAKGGKGADDAVGWGLFPCTPIYGHYKRLYIMIIEPWDIFGLFNRATPIMGVRKDFEPLKGSPAYKYFCIYTLIRCDPLPNSAFVEMHGHLEKMGSAWDISQSFVSMPPVFKGKATSRSTHFCEGGSTTNQMISSA
jgi:hypothetical protein